MNESPFETTRPEQGPDTQIRPEDGSETGKGREPIFQNEDIQNPEPVESAEGLEKETEPFIFDKKEGDEDSAFGQKTETSVQNVGVTELAPQDAMPESRMAELVANPMFVHFAHGRNDSFDAVLHDFERMLSAGGQVPASHMGAADAARMTPAAHPATMDVALNERQRALARAAGMSYREYYELARTVPGSNLWNQKGE